MKLVAKVDGDEDMQRVSKEQVCIVVYFVAEFCGKFVDKWPNTY